MPSSPTPLGWPALAAFGSKPRPLSSTVSATLEGRRCRYTRHDVACACLATFVVASCTTRNRHVSTSTAARSSMPECTNWTGMPVRSEKPFRYQSSAGASPVSSSIGGCSSLEISRADWSAASVTERASSIAPEAPSGSDRRTTASCIFTAVSACPISSCNSRAISRRSSSWAFTRRAESRWSWTALAALAASSALRRRSSLVRCLDTKAATTRLTSSAAPPVTRNRFFDRPYTVASRRCCCCRCDRFRAWTCATMRKTLSRRGMMRSFSSRRRSAARLAGGSVMMGSTELQ